MLAPDAQDAGWSGAAQVVDASGATRQLVRSGLSAGPGSRPCSPSTRFQAGSISKQLLSVVALALAERGAVDLHEPVARWLPRVPRAWSTITLHQLLSHTSGIGHWGDLPGSPALLTAPPTPAELLERTTAAPLVTAPGAAWRYSGPGYLVAARVLEAAGGSPYADLVSRTVLQPAAMTSTTSGRFPLPGHDVAAGHRGGQRVHVDPGLTAIPGTGDLWTTTADLTSYSRALRSGRLIATTSAAALWTVHATPPPPSAPPVSTDAGAAEAVTASGYGYGTSTGRVLGRAAVFVAGDNPGYQSLLAHFPDDGTDVAVLTNDEVPGVAGALASITTR